jgi:hypothetical protein
MFASRLCSPDASANEYEEHKGRGVNNRVAILSVERSFFCSFDHSGGER